MIKKLFSKAFLSMVMDKNARETLETRKKKKPAAKDASETTPKTARREGDPGKVARESLEIAKRELEARPEMTSERQALIQKAMELQRSKAHVLDSLSAEQREKLYVVAMRSLDADPGSLVRQKGGKRKKGGK